MNKRSHGNTGILLESLWKLAANTSVMTNKLLKMAFDKAEQECASQVTTKLSNHLSDVIFTISGEQYGERSLRTKYNNIISNPNEQVEFNQYVKDALSQYIGFANYLEFIRNGEETPSPQVRKFGFLNVLKNNKWSVVTILLVMIATSAFFMVDTQKWMEWQDGQYVEVAFDTEKLTSGILKVLKEDRVEHFKKIHPNCDTEFFNKNGNTTIWYGKNHKRELEYYTDLGRHPETGKSLKPITSYMSRNTFVKTTTKYLQKKRPNISLGLLYRKYNSHYFLAINTVSII